MSEDESIHNEDGVDMTYVRAMLELTPAERLKLLENHVNAIVEAWERNGLGYLY